MPNKIAQEKFKKVLTQIVEPIVLGVIALLFIIPAVTVFNLTPITKTLEKLNVLGAKSEESLEFTLVEGRHSIVRNEYLNKNEDGTYTYTTTLIKRSADIYSKPIIEVKNNTGIVQTVILYGRTESPTKTNISAIIDDVSYKLQDEKSLTYPQEIKFNPGSKTIIFLSLENFSGVQFSEEFEMDIKIKSN